MAYGLQWGGVIGKYIFKRFFVLLLQLVILWYLIKSFNKSHHKLFYYSLAFIFAGAVGNIIDSMFYGLIFSESGVFGFDYATCTFCALWSRLCTFYARSSCRYALFPHYKYYAARMVAYMGRQTIYFFSTNF